LNDSYDVELKNKAKKLDIPVNFLGKVSHKKIPSLLEKAHFFVSASLMEVQSLAVLEALASGTPIISLPNETTSEFVDETVGYNFEGLVEPATFAEKIESLASISTKEYKNMCIEAREKVADLDWCNIAVQTVEMYKELIERKEVSRKGLNGLKKLFDTIDISLFE
jgi:glycosyltransferase involved in cell wall biosynthesis